MTKRTIAAAQPDTLADLYIALADMLAIASAGEDTNEHTIYIEGSLRLERETLSDGSAVWNIIAKGEA